MFSRSPLYNSDIRMIKECGLDWSALSGSRILIVGATGLMGTVVVDALMAISREGGLGIEVLAMARGDDLVKKRFNHYLDSPGFTFIKHDITKPISGVGGIDYIINLASNTHPKLYASRPIETIETITLGSMNVLSFATENSAKRVINGSTVEIYGEPTDPSMIFSESDAGYINCNSLRAGYPEAKRLSESLCQAYISEKGLDVVSARLGRVYGPTILESDLKAVSQFIFRALEGKNIILKSLGNQRYSFIYVADAVGALLNLLLAGRSGEAYNIAHSEIKSLREVAEAAAKVGGVGVEFDIPTEIERIGASVVQNALMNCDKIAKLGWIPEYDIERGFDRTIRILKGE